MILVLNGPYWFRGIDAILGLIFALVTLLIAAVSYKAYKLTKEKKYSYFSLAFIGITIAYIFLGISKILLTTHISDTLTNLLWEFDVSFLVHMGLMFLSFITLLIITLKIKDKLAMAFMIATTLLLTLFAYQYYLKFHIISFLLLFFLSYKFYTNYLEKKNYNAKLVFTSFYLLTCAEVFFVAILYLQSFYVVGAILQLLGYLLLFYVFLRVIYYGRKTRKA